MMFRKSDSKPPAQSNETKPKEEPKQKPFELFECDHYQYELARCGTIRTRITDYYSGSDTQQDCSKYEDLFASCLDWYRSGSQAAFKKLYDYESKLVEERKKASEANDVWEKRTAPPEDWNSPLPDWCVERLKDTVWYKQSKSN